MFIRQVVLRDKRVCFLMFTSCSYTCWSIEPAFYALGMSSSSMSSILHRCFFTALSFFSVSFSRSKYCIQVSPKVTKFRLNWIRSKYASASYDTVQDAHFNRDISNVFGPTVQFVSSNSGCHVKSLGSTIKDHQNLWALILSLQVYPVWCTVTFVGLLWADTSTSISNKIMVFGCIRRDKPTILIDVFSSNNSNRIVLEC